jgi:hypothetical protein
LFESQAHSNQILLRKTNARKNMKLLITAFLIMLSSAALHAQEAAAAPAAAAPNHLGYAEETQLIKLASRDAALKPIYAWAREVVTIHFDPASSDIAKKENAPAISSRYNHDGKAFVGFVRSTSSESYYDNVVDYRQSNKNAVDYKTNLKSGTWRGFVNGE